MLAIDLGLCISFENELQVVVQDFNNRCKPNNLTIKTHSNTDDRTWTILKTSKSFDISGDDFEQFSMNFDDLECGHVAELTNFSWMLFSTKLCGVSSAFYFESRGKKVPGYNRSVSTVTLHNFFKG